MGLSGPTVQQYVSLLEEVFLIRRIPAWSRNIKTQLIRSPKIVFVDSGIASTLLKETETTLLRGDSNLGSLLEGFVSMEIARQCSWADEETDIYHYRSRNKSEVDLVLERGRKVVAIEIKASQTIRTDDFKGIRDLKDRLGDDLIVGIVLYLGDQTLSFGEKMRAVPVSALWEME